MSSSPQPTAAKTSLRDRLTSPGLELTRSDTRILRALLGDYPAAGLGTAASLARRANVSDPTVTRLMLKLGFASFGEFQKALLAEVDKRMRSPLAMMEEKRSNAHDREQSPAQGYLRSVASCLDHTLLRTPPHSYDVAVKLILGASGRVLLLGGRFSRHLAGILAGYLSQIRVGVSDITMLSVESFDTLIDIDRSDVLVVFDYRRYQTDVVRFAQQAVARRAALVLFTDTWQSPLAALAQTVITAETEVNSPYDSLVPGLAQVEAVAKQILTLTGDTARERIERMEAVRSSNAVTIDKTAELNSSTAPGPSPDKGTLRRRGYKHIPGNRRSVPAQPKTRS